MLKKLRVVRIKVIFKLFIDATESQSHHHPSDPGWRVVVLKCAFELWWDLVSEHIFVIVHHAVYCTQDLIPVILN